jgi:hypothetical protein
MESIEEYSVKRREAEVWWAGHKLMDCILASLETLARSPNTAAQRLTQGGTEAKMPYLRPRRAEKKSEILVRWVRVQTA